MKKKILGIALVLASLIGTSAMAQSPSNPQQQPSQTTISPAAKAMANPFDGLNLTEKQQSELKALQEECKAERQKIAKQKKDERKQIKEQRKNNAKEYLAKIKGILTPEQYVQFLENAFLNKGACPFGRPKNGKHGMRPGKYNIDGRQADKRKPYGQRGQRAAANAPVQNTTN